MRWSQIHFIQEREINGKQVFWREMSGLLLIHWHLLSEDIRLHKRLCFPDLSTTKGKILKCGTNDFKMSTMTFSGRESGTKRGKRSRQIIVFDAFLGATFRLPFLSFHPLLFLLSHPLALPTSTPRSFSVLLGEELINWFVLGCEWLRAANV